MSVFKNLSDSDAYNILTRSIAIMRSRYYSYNSPKIKPRNSFDFEETIYLVCIDCNIVDDVADDFVGEMLINMSIPSFMEDFGIDLMRGLSKRKAISVLNWYVNQIRHRTKVVRNPTTFKTRKLSF